MPSRLEFALYVAVTLCWAVSGTIAAEPEALGRFSDEQLKAQGFTPLIRGDTLDGWNVRNWHNEHWTIREGVIDYDGKGEHKQFQKNSLWTTTKYGDLVLYAEWRLHAKPAMKAHPIVLYNGDFLLDDQGRRITRPHVDAGDSGLLFRGKAKCQANIWSQVLGSGEINGYRTDREMPPEVRRACIPLKNADRPLGEWNAFLITLRGNVMTVQLNGVTVIPAASLPGLPAVGPIGLQHHGDPVQFRRLWIKSTDGE
jgi:hypothetical protein